MNVSTAALELQWSWVAGASYMMVYQAQIATDTNFSSHFICDSTFRHMPHVIFLSLPAAKITNNTTFWRVRVSDTAAGSQWSPWSETWKFTTGATTSVAHDRPAHLAAAALVEIGAARSKLFVRNAGTGSVVSIFDMAGKLLLNAAGLPGEQAIALPSGISGKLLAITVRNAGKMLRDALVMP